jgi:hypothetical protein
MARVPFDPTADYYALLGVPVFASPEEIQAAYRRLAKEYHPDLHADSDTAATRMARLNVAKSVLLDRETRAYYDQVRGSRLRTTVARSTSSNGTRPRATAASTVAAASRPTSYASGPSIHPRSRVGSYGRGQGASRGQLDRSTGILLLVAVPLIAALVIYLFEAVQLSIQPLHTPPADVNLSQGPPVRPTARGAAEAVFMMVQAQPPSRELATRANNFILARSDSSPESELLRADGRKLLRAASSGDGEGWDQTVQDLCQLAGQC